MKKRLLSILIVLMMLALSACGGGADTGTAEENADTGQDIEQSESSEDSADSSEGITAMPEFTTSDLEGNTVTNEIFSQADITIVNFWGTYCGPCINEMPDLAAWDEELPDNVQLIGIVIDVADTSSEEFATANEIISETGVKYTNLMVSQDFADIFNELVGVPTTIFVDSEGNIVGDWIVGADMRRYRKVLEGLL